MRAALFLGVYLQFTAATMSEKKIVCIVSATQGISHLDPTMCTHVIYYGAEIRESALAITRPWANIADHGALNGYGRTNALRRKNPTLKTMLSLDGLITDYVKCPHVVTNSTCVERVADNILQFVKHWHFDGVNMFWDFLNQDPGPIENRLNMIELLKYLRKLCDKEGLVMSINVWAVENQASKFYDIPELSKYPHFVILRTVYFYGPWNEETRIGAPLQARYNDSALDRTKSVEASVMYWLSQGVLRNKVIISLTATGPAFTLANPNQHGIGAKIRDVGTAGHFSSSAGAMGYNEVCTLHKTGDWKMVFDEDYRAPYTFQGDQWIAYDNVKSAREKAEFIVRLDLSGVVLVNVDTDDYRGLCGQKSPLLRTLNAVLRNTDPVPEESLPLKCTESGYVTDPHSCGLIMCAPNISGGFNDYHFECRPGNCHNPIIGDIRGEDVDVNFFICGD